ncbi:MAG: helix-hairpin-helix domain-containing protein [Synergistaceae bacterium]|nr:helix-hairpin-helix domain-containing protein [Synergistaceae bacterium]
MQEFFNKYRKIIIPSSGVVLFLITGAIAMFMTSSSPKVREEPLPQTLPQTKQAAQAQTEEIPESPKPDIEPQQQKRPGEDWFVYVTGAVHKPGVYKLPDNPRVFHAINAAGGMTLKADQKSLNLAEKIFSDGLHIHVFEKGEREAQEAKAAEKVRQARESVRESQVQPVNVRVPGVQVTQVSGARTQTQSQNTGLVDVNHASEQELTRLKGVGPAIAKRIIEFRKNMGSFKSPEDLLQVRGIGPKTLDKMRSQILIR